MSGDNFETRMTIKDLTPKSHGRINLDNKEGR